MWQRRIIIICLIILAYLAGIMTKIGVILIVDNTNSTCPAENSQLDYNFINI